MSNRPGLLPGWLSYTSLWIAIPKVLTTPHLSPGFLSQLAKHNMLGSGAEPLVLMLA